MTILVAVGMEQEATLVRQVCPKAIVVIGAGDAALLTARMKDALKQNTVDRIISVGVCGGIAPDMKVGQIVVCSSVVYQLSQIATDIAWSNRILASIPAAQLVRFTWSATAVARMVDKVTLRRVTMADVVDEETFIAGSIAVPKGIPFTALRVISDGPDFELPPAALIQLTSAGNDNIGAILDSIAGDPWQIPELVELAGSTATAMAGLKIALTRLGSNLNA